MKNISIILLTLLLLVPPVQAHADAIIFTDSSIGNHIDIIDDAHNDEHHKNDTKEEKNKEHHHHCIFLGISNAIITSEFKYQFVRTVLQKKKILYYQNFNTFNYLDELFQPPRYNSIF